MSEKEKCLFARQARKWLRGSNPLKYNTIILSHICKHGINKRNVLTKKIVTSTVEGVAV